MHTLHTEYIHNMLCDGGRCCCCWVLTQKCLTFCLQSNKALPRHRSGEYLEFFCGQITKEHNGSPSQESGVKTHIPIMQCRDMKCALHIICTWINESSHAGMLDKDQYNWKRRSLVALVFTDLHHPNFRWKFDWMTVYIESVLRNY